MALNKNMKPLCIRLHRYGSNMLYLAMMQFATACTALLLGISLKFELTLSLV